MSKLANLIETKQMHRVLVQEPVSNLKVESHVVQPAHSEHFMYRLGVYFEVRGAAKSSAQVQLLKDSAKRQMIHSIFDEFRPMIRAVELAIMERNWEGAHLALQELENEMYS